jgi:hypothetical protein
VFPQQSADLTLNRAEIAQRSGIPISIRRAEPGVQGGQRVG